MDCQQARRRASNDEQAARHVATCRMCNSVIAHPDVELTLKAAAAAFAQPVMADAWAGLQSQLAAERGPVARLRALPRAWVATIALALSLAVIVLVDGTARGPHWDRWPLWHQLTTLIGGSALLGGGLALGLRSIFRAPTKTVLWATGAAGILFGAVLAMTPETLGAPVDTTPFEWTAAFGKGAWGCMQFGLLTTAPLFVWLSLSHRWQPMRPSRRFAAAATSALVGVLALEMHCPALGLMHRLVGHACLGLVLATLALVVGLVRRP